MTLAKIGTTVEAISVDAGSPLDTPLIKIYGMLKEVSLLPIEAWRFRGIISTLRRSTPKSVDCLLLPDKGFELETESRVKPLQS